jgi:hypothetical protein
MTLWSLFWMLFGGSENATTEPSTRAEADPDG